MYYLPRKDKVYGMAIWLLPLIMLLLLIFQNSLAVIVIFILSNLFSLRVWNSTNYKIENDELFIRCWIFRKRVKIANIKKVVKTKNIYSSYTLSTDKLEITESEKGQFYIAPNNFESFTEELKKINSKIIF